MNFTDAVNEVVGIIKRPDKISDVRREINAALTVFCLDNDFPRDFMEQKIDLDPQEYTQSFSIDTLVRFRKFKYLRRGPKAYLTVLSENEIFNKNVEQSTIFKDRYYIAGDTINIALGFLASSIDVGYFMYPPFLTGTITANTYWMLDMAPYMVIDKAAASLFRVIGDETSMKTHLMSMNEAYSTFRKDQRSVL